MIQRNLKEGEEILKRNLQHLRDKYDIKLIYVFGSYSKGTNTEDSDLDIAVLLGNSCTYIEHLDLIGNFCTMFKRNDVD